MLSEIIADKIASNGPLSFRDFMEMALYHPELGYYTSGRNVIGNTGDYYTCPCLSSAFGFALAEQLHEMWLLSGLEEFTIVEYGAGNGALSRDILSYFKEHTDLF